MLTTKWYLSVLALASVYLFAGCALQEQKSSSASQTAQSPVVAGAVESSRPTEAERMLAEKHRQCQDEKRRLDSALKENQKRNEELQKKLDGLLAIDRDLRSRGKVR